jgi:hypothetical protein
VALQVDPAQAGDVARPEQVEADDGAEVGRIVDEALHRVAGRCGVCRRRSSQLARFASR